MVGILVPMTIFLIPIFLLQASVIVYIVLLTVSGLILIGKSRVVGYKISHHLLVGLPPFFVALWLVSLVLAGHYRHLVV